MLPQLLAQVALRTDDDAAADIVRQALAACCSGENELVRDLGFDEAIINVGPKLVLVNLLWRAASFDWLLQNRRRNGNAIRCGHLAGISITWLLSSRALLPLTSGP